MGAGSAWVSNVVASSAAAAGPKSIVLMEPPCQRESHDPAVRELIFVRKTSANRPSALGKFLCGAHRREAAVIDLVRREDGGRSVRLASLELLVVRREIRLGRVEELPEVADD